MKENRFEIQKIFLQTITSIIDIGMNILSLSSTTFTAKGYHDNFVVYGNHSSLHRH